METSFSKYLHKLFIYTYWAGHQCVMYFFLDIQEKIDTLFSEYIMTDNILAGYLITKEKRHEIFGTVAGAGSTNPENYQRQKIIELSGYACCKTITRINMRSKQLIDIAHPNTHADGFDYSEDFDGVQKIDNITIYINLKCIVGKGGAQTRSLREVYWFIEAQLHVLKNDSHVYFANILDGDEAHYAMTKYEYLLDLPEFSNVKHKIYVGDLKGYFNWFMKIKTNQSDDV